MNRIHRSSLCLMLAGLLIIIGCSQKNKEIQPSVTEVVVGPTSSLSETMMKYSSDIEKLVDNLSLEELTMQMTSSLEELLPEKDTYTYIENTVSPDLMFPENINLGVAGDVDTLYQIGEYNGTKLKSAGALISKANVASTMQNPLYSGAKNSFSGDYKQVYTLGEAYVKGLAHAGIMPCLTDFIGAGYAKNDEDVTLSEDEIRQQLYIYRRLLDAILEENENLPVAIQVSSVSINGTKMIENKEMLNDMLRGTMKYQGLVIGRASDIELIDKGELKEKVAAVINAGVDVISEPGSSAMYKEAIKEAVLDHIVPFDRIKESVIRILKTKKALGLFDHENGTANANKPNIEEANELAASLAMQSVVLLQNSTKILPLKKGSSIYIMGPAANNMEMQTARELTKEQKANIKDGGTILDGFISFAKQYEYTIITDKEKAKNADVILLCLGESPSYEESVTDNLSLTSDNGEDENTIAIEEAKKLRLPVVTLLIAGRQLNLNPYRNEWDSVVMCYLPGSRGDAIANVLSGKNSFTGKLTMPWYDSDTEFTEDHILYGIGYGREY